MKILFATFKSPQDFLDRLEVADPDGPGSICVQTKARYVESEEVILEIGFPGLPNRILLRAVWSGEAESGRGARFRFREGDEDKRDFLLAVAGGCATASWKRRHRRFPLRMPVSYRVEGGEESRAETEEMGSGGVQLKTDTELPDGVKVSVVLEPLDGSDPIEFEGRVVWSRGGAAAGVGIQFERLDGEAMTRLRHLIRQVKWRGETQE